jgi:hypothetical protein
MENNEINSTKFGSMGNKIKKSFSLFSSCETIQVLMNITYTNLRLQDIVEVTVYVINNLIHE